MLWFFKLTAAPVLVAIMSLAARRWGPTIGGLIMGLPWMTGPVNFVLTLEKGTAWAERAMIGILLAVVGIAAYVVAYTHAARRFGWPVSLAVAAVAFALSSLALTHVELTVTPAAALALASLAAGFLLAARPQGEGVPGPLPWWDIPARMLATAALVLVIAFTAEIAGPVSSGMVSTYPVIATVVGVFTHHRYGAAAVTRLFRGLLLSLSGFVMFFVVASATLARFGLVASYALAACTALSVSAVFLVINRFRRRA